VAVVKIQGNASDVWTSPSVDTTIAGWTNELAVHIFGSAQSYEWWRHAITDTGNSDGYVSAGRICLADIFEPERNFTLGGGMREPQDPSIGSFSEGGQISSIQRTKYKTGNFFFDKLTRTDMETLKGMFSTLGNWKGLFFVQDLGDPWNDTYYVRVASYSITPQYNDRFDISLQLEELR